MKMFGAVFFVVLVVSVPTECYFSYSGKGEVKKTTNWDGYIDQLVGAQENIDKVCIFSKTDGQLLTSPDHPNALDLNAAEITAFVSAFQNDDMGDFETQGVHAEGQKYMFIGQDDAGAIKAIKIGAGGGVIADETNTAIVVVHSTTSSRFILPQVNVALGNVVGQMKSQGL